MNHRGLATVSTVAVLVLLAPAFVLAQLAQSTPRTQWGAADLRGVWNNSTLTPFQRPAELGDREFLTDEEAASIEQRTADRNRDLANRGALRTVADPNASVDRGVDGAPGRTTISGWNAEPRSSRRNAPRSSWTRRTAGCRP